MKPENILEIDDLEVDFRTLDGIVRGINGVTLNIRQGETLGVVGESRLRQKRDRPQHFTTAAQARRLDPARGNHVPAAQRRRG